MREDTRSASASHLVHRVEGLSFGPRVGSVVSRIEGLRSRVEGRGPRVGSVVSRIEGSRSKVEGRGSRVQGCIEGEGSRAEG